MHYHAEVYLEKLDNVKEQIAEIMAPFEEYGCRDWSKDEEEKYLVFNNEETEYRHKYENDSADKIIMPDGRILNPWDNEFRVEGQIGFGSGTHQPPENLKKRKIPFRELYSTFGQFMEDWCDMKRNPKTGFYGYWHNPNGFWDWWQIGGRWTGTHTDYDPTKDERNIEMCWICHGTGYRNDELGQRERRKNPTYTCNGCGEYDSENQQWKHGPYGKGRSLKWPTSWAEYKGDILPIAEVKDDLSCYTLIVNGFTLKKEEWNGKTFVKQDFDGNVKEWLHKMNIVDGYLVTVDYHC